MILEQHEKYSEMTYGVHAAILAAIAPDNAVTLMPQAELATALKALDHGVMGARRSLITTFQLLRQAIGYGLTYKLSYDTLLEGSEPVRPHLLFAVYKRNKLNSAKELQSVLSLCAGGHVEGEDLSYHIIKPKEQGESHQTSGAVDMLETIDDSFAAEYLQEVHLADAGNIDMTEGVVGAQMAKGFEKLGFVMDSKPEDATYVGNIHFGVLYALEAPPEVVSFEMREPQNEGVAWATAGDLVVQPDALAGLPYEPWSQMIVNAIAEIEAYILETFHGVSKLTTTLHVEVDPADPEPERTVELARDAFYEAQELDIRQQLESIAKEAWATVTADTSLDIVGAAKAVEKLTIDVIKEKLGAFITDRFRVEVTPLAGQDQEGHFFTLDMNVTKLSGEIVDVPTKQYLVTAEASEA